MNTTSNFLFLYQDWIKTKTYKLSLTVPIVNNKHYDLNILDMDLKLFKHCVDNKDFNKISILSSYVKSTYYIFRTKQSSEDPEFVPRDIYLDNLREPKNKEIFDSFIKIYSYNIDSNCCLNKKGSDSIFEYSNDITSTFIYSKQLIELIDKSSIEDIKYIVMRILEKNCINFKYFIVQGEFTDYLYYKELIYFYIPEDFIEIKIYNILFNMSFVEGKSEIQKKYLSIINEQLHDCSDPDEVLDLIVNKMTLELSNEQLRQLILCIKRKYDLNDIISFIKNLE